MQKIVCVYVDFQPLFRTLQIEEPNIVFTNSLQNLKAIVENDSILVIDDQFQALNKVHDCQIIKNYFLVHSHHQRVSTIGIFQAPYHRSMREISLNSQYVILFDFNRDRTVINSFAKQICPCQTKFLQSADKICVRKDYKYMLMDFHPKHKRFCWAKSS